MISLSRTRLLGLALLPALILTVVGEASLLSPKRQQCQQLLAAAKPLQQSLDQQRHLLSTRDGLRRKSQQLQSIMRSQSLLSTLPERFAELSRAAEALGLTIEAMRQERESQHDFYVALPVHLALVGGYDQLAAFLAQLASLKSVVTIHDFSLTPCTEGHYQRLRLVLTLQFYRFLL